MKDQSAFPHSSVTVYEDGDARYTDPSAGMTLRDYFAGQALAGLLARDQSSGAHWGGSYRDASEAAYRFAEAMLQARKDTQ